MSTKGVRRAFAIAVTTIGLFGVEAASAKAAGYDWMYDPDGIAEINLWLPQASRDALAIDPGEYVPGTFEIEGSGGETFGPVPTQVRLKGSYSFRTLDGKAAFKLKFANPNRPWGLKKMTLNNMLQDPTKVHETLAYEVFREMGVPASRTGYANVAVDGDPYGLYLNLETLDDKSMDHLFDSTQHLYEGAFTADFKPELAHLFEVDEGDEEDTTDLEALIAAAGTPPSGWRAAIEPHADLDEMVRMWATELYVGQWDGYVRHANNFYVHSDEDGVFSMLPSGLDQSFVNWFEFFEDDPLVQPRSILFSRCLAVPSCRSEYTSAVIAVHNTVENMHLPSRLADLYAMLRPSILADPRKENTIEDSDFWISRIEPFLDEQADNLANRLTLAPKSPTGVGAEPAPAAIEVSWNEAMTKGAKPVSGYVVRYRPSDSGEFAELAVDDPAAREATITGLRGGTGYEIRVRAASSAGPGAWAALPEPVQAGVRRFGAPSIHSGPSGPVAYNHAAFAFTGEAGATYACTLDDGPQQECSSPFKLENLAEGPHRISIVQLDAGGNPSDALVREWIVDSVVPVAPVFVSGPSGPTATRAARIAFSTEPGAASQCRLNDLTWAECSSPLVLTGLAQGRHRLSIRQFDAAGNVSATARRDWVVDTVRPRLRSVKLLSRSGRVHRVRLDVDLEPSALWVHVSPARKKPHPKAGRGKPSRLNRKVLGIRHPGRIRWARVSDAAGNYSAWKTIK